MVYMVRHGEVLHNRLKQYNNQDEDNKMELSKLKARKLLKI